jgi:DNA-binding beta-propeller fold protein YncE
MAIIKTLSVTSLLAILLCIGCGRGIRTTPGATGSLLVSVDATAQTLTLDNIRSDGSLSTQTTAGTFQQPTKLLTLGNNIYALNAGSNSVTQFTVSAAGQVTVGASVLAGTAPVQFALDPTNKFLVVANQGSKSLSIYSVASDGTLLSINNGFPLAFSPLLLAFAGETLYVADSTAIAGLQLDATTGQLTALSNFSLPGANLSYLLADGSGSHLLATDMATNTVIPFSIAPTTGSLTQLAVAPTGTGPIVMTFGPGGTLLYVVNNVSDDVSVFAFNASTGALLPVSGSPFPTLLHTADSVAVDAIDGFLFVASAAGKQVATLRVNFTTGALVAVSNSPFAVNSSPAWLAVITPMP